MHPLTSSRPPRSGRLALFAACFFLALACGTADAGLRLLQIGEEESVLSESARVLVGHWRKTTIVFESARDEHLVLEADGTAENWIVTASSRGEKSTGRWSVEGKILTLTFEEGGERSAPFTLYNGQLVFPNIQNRRGFWERLN